MMSCHCSSTQNGGSGAGGVPIQRIRADARAGLPGAEDRQPDSRAKGPVHPLGAGTHRRQRLKRANQPPGSSPQAARERLVAPACLDQGRGRVPVPPRVFGSGWGARSYPPSDGSSRAFGLP